MWARLLPVSRSLNRVCYQSKLTYLVWFFTYFQVFQAAAFRGRAQVGYSTPSPERFAETVQEAREKLLVAGFDPASFIEQPIVWGDQDAFQ